MKKRSAFLICTLLLIYIIIQLITTTEPMQERKSCNYDPQPTLAELISLESNERVSCYELFQYKQTEPLGVEIDFKFEQDIDYFEQDIDYTENIFISHQPLPQFFTHHTFSEDSHITMNDIRIGIQTLS